MIRRQLLHIACLAAITALPLSLAGCSSEDDAPEVLHEPGIVYESDNGLYSYVLEATTWPPTADNFPLRIQIYPLTPEDGDTTVDLECKPPARWPSFDLTAAPPTVTPEANNRFDLDFQITTPGYWIQEITITDAEGNEDTCHVALQLRDRP